MVISEINTIDQLNRNLNMGPGYGGYLDILKAIKLPKEEWEPLCKWNSENYSRHCLNSCDSFELILMCWKKGQASPIHNYNFQEGWIKVLEGELEIDLFRLNKEGSKAELDETLRIKAKEYAYLNDTMGFHRVRASGEGKTVSLHLHASKVEKWEVFNEEVGELEVVIPTYDTKHKDCK